MNFPEIYKKLSPARIAEIELKTKREYEENEDLKREDVVAVVEWLEKQPHMPQLLELHVIAFLYRCRYNREMCKRRLDTFFTIRSACPQVFSNRNPLDPICRRLADVSLVTLLPKTTPEGYKIVYARLWDPDPRSYGFAEQLKVLDMVMFCLVFQEGFRSRYVIVIDQEGSTLEHLVKTDLLVAKTIALYVQHAVPLRIKNVHLINPFAFVDRMVNIAKLFFSSKRMQKFIVHKNVETLYEYVPKDCMPKEYGGSAGSFRELHEAQKKKLLEQADIFEIDNGLKVDEAKRPERARYPQNGDLGVEGTFRKLNVD